MVGSRVLGGLVLLAAGVVAGGSRWRRSGCSSAGSRAGEHPLWSSFVWRNELADTFVEVVAAPWFAGAATGTPVLTVWLRAMGARIGRGVWCETYWLPEADLVRLGDGATVGRGCVVQTHLFHDRIMSLDAVTHRRGRDARPERGRSCRRPASARARPSGPASLVMRGEHRPARDPLGRQPDRAVERGGVTPRDGTAPPGATPTRTCPRTATPATASSTTTSTSTTGSRRNRLTGTATCDRPPRRGAASRFSLDLAGSAVHARDASTAGRRSSPADPTPRAA